MSTIGKLRIKGVRGIRAELALDLDGRSLLLRGDNGTGKSSIAQALRWAVTGSPTSPTADVLPEEFQRHRLESAPSACEVVVELVPSGRIVMRGGLRDDTETDDIGRSYFESCVRSSPFLRRDELLGFLSDAPGERYKYLERFLELDRVERLGAALGPVIKKHEALRKDAETERAGLIASAVRHLPGEDTAPKGTSELLARLYARARMLGRNVDGEQQTFDGLPGLLSRLGGLASSPNGTARRAELTAALERSLALVPPDHPRTVLDRLRDAEQHALENDLAPLLTAALAVVERTTTLENCPVCEQTVEAGTLGVRLRARLAILADVRACTRDTEVLASEWHAFLVALDGLESFAAREDEARLSPPIGRPLLEELATRHGDALASVVLSRLEVVRRLLETQRDAIADDVRLLHLGQLAAAVAAATASREHLERCEADIERHGTLAKQLRAVEKAVGDARKNTADEILKSIAGLVSEYYERIHPPKAVDEVTGAPTIQVKRHGSGTAHVRGRFNDEEIDDPRLIYSDGHLDTVGVCVFLALRKRATSGARLLVLDDVVLSIDIGHAQRLVALLRDEFKGHQILLLSHNELFMKMCRAPLSGAKQLEIVRWTLEDGPRLAAHVSHVDELQRKLEESGSAVMVANAMRPLLDDLLDSACSAFALKVPRSRDAALTVDEYWSPLKKKLTELTRAGILPDLSQVFDAVGTPSFFRNALGAHLNEWALEVALGQVQSVAHGILALQEALACPRCQAVRHLVNRHDVSAGLGCQCPTPSDWPAAQLSTIQESAS